MTTPGQLIRRLLGPLIGPVARVYRSLYVDLDSWGTSLSIYDDIDGVLEIGCGDGLLCEVLATRLPDATILGIDVADEPGRLYSGRSRGVKFRQVGAAELAESGAVFDLVVLCDVLHHVPVQERAELVKSAWRLVGSEGKLAVKDWVKTSNPSTLAAYLSDRYVTGDKPVFFDSLQSLATLLEVNCIEGRIIAGGSVPPRKNNRFLIYKRS